MGRFDDTAATGLAGIILDHAAMAMGEEPGAVGMSMGSLSSVTGMALDVAAGVLLAATVLIAGGHLTVEQVAALSTVYVEIADDEGPGPENEQAPGPGPSTTDEDDRIDPRLNDDQADDDAIPALVEVLGWEPDFSMFPAPERDTSGTDEIGEQQ